MKFIHYLNASYSYCYASQPTADQPLPPAQALQTMRELLRDVFLRQFGEASHARDATSATRFFKLFPPIGWEQEGLQAYASFVVDLVQTRAPTTAKSESPAIVTVTDLDTDSGRRKASSPLYYVTSFTAVFESVCSIVDQHQPVVEKYYGPRKMQFVAKSLIQECGKAVKRLLEGWEEERSMKRKARADHKMLF